MAAVPYYDWIAHHAGHSPEKLAAVDLASGRHLTYRQFDARIGRLAAYLGDALGIGRGDRIAALGQNSTDIFEVQFACGRIGAIFVPLNWRLTVPELTFILNDATPRVLIHDAEFADVVEQLRRRCEVPHRIERGAVDSAYERAIASARPLAARERVSHDDVSTIMYTSGTTGSPKGAMITHGMTFWNAVNITGPAYLTTDSVCLTVLPLFHTGGLNVFANPVFHYGGTVLVMRSFDPAETLRLLGDPAERITHFLGVPAHFQFMGQHPAFAEAQFSHLVCVAAGGAPIAVPLLQIWHERGLPVTQGYGMTETSPLVLWLDRGEAVRKAGSCGRPVLHNAVRIVRDNGSDAAPGEVGELWVRGPNVTPGYWHRPDATKATFTDEWLHTGDAAMVDDEGYYYIVDRWKDMYISGGENVYPAEVENVLYQIEAVAEAAVIGVPDERWGEVGRAIIVVKPGHALEEREIVEHCRANLAGFKLPRSVRFIEALPRNATGKVHKPTLRQQFGKA